MKSIDSLRKSLPTERVVRAEYARLAEEFTKPRKRIIDMRKKTSFAQSKRRRPHS